MKSQNNNYDNKVSVNTLIELITADNFLKKQTPLDEINRILNIVLTELATLDDQDLERLLDKYRK